MSVRILYFLLAFGGILIDVSSSSNEPLARDNINVPCSYFDTIDLTNSIPYPNGSYLYDNIVIPLNLIGLYDYHLTSLTTRIPTELHLRGCICLVKPCIKWCCNGQNEYLDNRNCIETHQNLSNELIVGKNFNENFTTNIYTYFYPQKYYLPCDHMYDLNPDLYEYDEWQLFENGSLYRFEDKEFFRKQEFCLTQYPTDENSTSNYRIAPFVCYFEQSDTSRDILYSYTMLFSLPFMIVTIIIYLIIPELRNLHGKSLACYLSGLVLAYSVFSYIMITTGKNISILTCATLGYTAYFFYISSFLWLSVISFDLYWNFRGTRLSRLNESKRFLYYCLYAWGIAAILLSFTIFAQNSDLIPKKYKPGIGTEEYCWLDMTTNFSAAIYFYGPCLFLIVFNILMFVLTSCKIYRVQREMIKIVSREDSRKNLISEKDQFTLFLRLFIVMGVTWVAEILSYFLGQKHDYIFRVADYLNMIQGFFIFALFVLKKKVKLLILKRFKKSDLNNRSSQYSTKTNSSNAMTMTTIQSLNTEKPLLSTTTK